MNPVTLAMLGSAAGSLFQGIGGAIAGGKSAAGAMQGGQTSALMTLLGIQQAQQAEQQWYNNAATTLSPYTTAGAQSIKQLTDALTGTGAKTAGIGGGGANLLSTFQPTMEQLAKTPGYQFTLQQGTQQAQNAAAAKGLGSSANALKTGIDYAGGLASTTFNQQLQNYMQQNQQAYNMLLGPSQMGASAANTLAGGALNAGNTMANANLQGFNAAGNAYGGGMAQAANAIAGGTNALFGGTGQAASYGASAPLANIYAQANPNLSPYLQSALNSPASFGMPTNIFSNS